MLCTYGYGSIYLTDTTTLITPNATTNREVVEFIEEERGVRVAAPDEARFMVYTPAQLQRTDLKDLVIVQPEVRVCVREGRRGFM